MKLIKMLGLAMVAALAIMALFGASSASAKAPHVCTKATTPCEVADQQTYPLAVTSTLQSAEAELKGQGVPAVKCQASSVSGKLTEKNEAKQQVIGKIETLKFTACHIFGAINCTATELQIPYTAHLSQAATQSNGTLSVGPQTQGGGQPGARVVCPGSGTDCTFKTNEKQTTMIDTFENENVWANLEVIGGSPAKVKANQVALKAEPVTPQCPATATWDAEYSITAPNPAFVAHQS